MEEEKEDYTNIVDLERKYNLLLKAYNELRKELDMIR